MTATDQLLALNPVKVPDAWLRNALVHYYLHDFAAAEKSARQGMKVDDSHQVPKLEYFVGYPHAKASVSGSCRAH